MVDADGDVGVVFDEFLKSDFVIVLRVITSHNLMVLLKSVHELIKHFLFSLLARSDLGMHIALISVTKFLHINSAVTVDIQGSESSFDEASSELVHIANNDSE